jgi:hypothetical protein
MDEGRGEPRGICTVRVGTHGHARIVQINAAAPWKNLGNRPCLHHYDLLEKQTREDLHNERSSNLIDYR